ncbi:unnamed protein product, partial [marine sediment metagenome]
EKTTKWRVVVEQWLARIAGGFWEGGSHHGKLKELLDLLMGELSKQAVIVWFKYNLEIQAVATALRKAGITSRRILGSVSPDERERIRKAWIRERFEVLLIQLKCGKQGIDYSHADTAMYYSNTWDPEDRYQSEARIEHPEKRRPLLYLDLVAADTVDEDLIDALRAKKLESRYFLRRLLNRTRVRHLKGSEQ